MVKKLDYRTYLNYRQAENNRKVIKTANAYLYKSTVKGK
jgi:hypothetical protein